MSTTTAEPLEIVLYPDPFLGKTARAIKPDELKEGKAGGWVLADLIERMKVTMYAAEGIGLAAPQVGVGLRIFLVDISKDKSGCMALINPVLSKLEGTLTEEEGCLSIPGIRAKVKRFASLHVAATNLKGDQIEFDAADLMARVCQHENDHLNGILFINKLGMASRAMLRRSLGELEEDYELAQAKKNRKK